MVGSDDILACFIAGNTFTWEYGNQTGKILDTDIVQRLVQTRNHGRQFPAYYRHATQCICIHLVWSADLLLFVGFAERFAGAVCPWKEFYTNDVIPLYRLVILGILVLLLRRPPIVFAMHKSIHQIEEKRQAIYVGFFGPIGVSAIFYLYIAVDFLRKNVTIDGEPRADALFLMEATKIIVWFLVICSVVGLVLLFKYLC
jgi:sodium/hydrogen antiporter